MENDIWKMSCAHLPSIACTMLCFLLPLASQHSLVSALLPLSVCHFSECHAVNGKRLNEPQ